MLPIILFIDGGNIIYRLILSIATLTIYGFYRHTHTYEILEKNLMLIFLSMYLRNIFIYVFK